MNAISAVHERLEQASGLAEVLAVACEAFEEMREVDHAHHEADDPMFNRWLMAGTYAADGRDAVLSASVLAACPVHASAQTGFSSSIGDAERGGGVAELSGLLAARLAEAAAWCADAGGRLRCQDAARCARAIADLLAVGAP